MYELLKGMAIDWKWTRQSVKKKRSRKGQQAEKKVRLAEKKVKQNRSEAGPVTKQKEEEEGREVGDPEGDRCDHGKRKKVNDGSKRKVRKVSGHSPVARFVNPEVCR